jgi:hypothetical protein
MNFVRNELLCVFYRSVNSTLYRVCRKDNNTLTTRPTNTCGLVERGKN